METKEEIIAVKPIENKKEAELFLENKVYEGLFTIFELELEEISRFVAFTSGNMNVYSNKIHELHLRVCSEVENILKIVIHKHFVTTDEVKIFWDTDKSAFLEKKSLTPKYEELKIELNRDGKEKLDKLLFGFPDFLFYFKLACEKFNLHKKVIKFTGTVSQSIDWKTIQPFKLEEERNVPTWWTNYNKLKHDKIKNFHLCTLKDLIYSLSGLFILMNYLLKYPENNTPIENRNYLVEKIKQNVFISDVSFCSFNSKFFLATTAYQHVLYSMFLPQNIPENTYQSLQLGALDKAGKYFSDDKKHLELKNMDLKLFEHKMIWDNQEEIDESESIEHSIFYTYVDYLQVVDFNGNDYRELRHYAVFTN